MAQGDSGAVRQGRVLAPDLIGMGRSGKPDIGYRFADHARYLDAWFDALALEVVSAGQGIHFVQEDEPEAIARIVAEWRRRVSH